MMKISQRANVTFYRTTRIIALLFAWLICAPLWADETGSVALKSSKLSGTLVQEQGVGVLRLWGTPEEQGHAHGVLMGRQITEMIRLLFDTPQIFDDPQSYETGVRKNLLPQFKVTESEWAELRGIVKGIRETVGEEGMSLSRLGRPLDALDLLALNTLADWIPGGCSSFVAWGGKSGDGGTVVGRNLDYFDLPGLKELHLMIVRKGMLVRKGDSKEPGGWVSVAWPGLIGAYTAMNADGVVVAMHDVDAAPLKSMVRRRPRSLVLRDILETASASNALSVAEKTLRASPGTRGNNFLVATASSKADPCAAVFEYDGDVGTTKGVTVRDAVSSGIAKANFIACTNHYRKRVKPDWKCWRYETISQSLNSNRARIGSASAWKILESVAVDGTIHSMVAYPDSKTLELRFAAPGTNAHKHLTKHFTLANLLK